MEFKYVMTMALVILFILISVIIAKNTSEVIAADPLTSFYNLEVNSNPYGFGAHERGAWAADLDVKVGEPAEYIYFAGCENFLQKKLPPFIGGS